MRNFKPLEDGRSDHHIGPVEPLASVHSLGSLSGLTVVEVGLTASFCSLGRLINGHKWALLVRSMPPMRGHAYKRLEGCPE
jgi:hypothetical protein